jgi:hypothetical protein
MGSEYVMMGCDRLHFMVHVVLKRIGWVGHIPHIGTAGNPYEIFGWFVLEEDIKIGLVKQYIKV